MFTFPFGKDGAVVLFLILAATAVIFSPSLRNGFVNYDDAMFVTDNPLIRELSLPNIKKIFSNVHPGNPGHYFYAPLTVLSFAIEYHFVKLNPILYHIDNYILHLVNTGLVFWLLLLLTRDLKITAFVALLFGIHPMHVESVAWVAERKDVLFSFFYLGAMIRYVFFITKDERKGRNYAFTLLFFLFAVLSKVTAITLTGVLFALDYFCGRKFTKGLFYEKIPFVLITLLFGYFAMTHPGAGASNLPVHFAFWQRGLFSCYVILVYVIKILFPYNLVCGYPYPEKVQGAFPEAVTIAPLMVIALFLLLFSLRKEARDHRTILFGSLFFLITLAPVLPVVILREYLMADRYTYLPSIGVFLILGNILFRFVGPYIQAKKSELSVVIMVAGTAYFMFLSATAWQQCKTWRNGISLWSNVIDKYPNIALAYLNRGTSYLNQKRYLTAIEDFDKALQINPDHAAVYSNRGIAYKELGDLPSALRDYGKVIELQPDFAEGYYNRAMVYNVWGRRDRAIDDYNKTLQLAPDHALAYHNRGVEYYLQKKFDPALADINKAIHYDPYFVMAYVNRGNIYREKGQYEQALEEYKKAMKIAPEDVYPLLHRAKTYVKMQRYQDAVRDYNTFLDMAPDHQYAEPIKAEIKRLSAKEYSGSPQF